MLDNPETLQVFLAFLAVMLGQSIVLIGVSPNRANRLGMAIISFAVAFLGYKANLGYSALAPLIPGIISIIMIFFGKSKPKVRTTL